MITNINRIGNFTSSEIVALTTSPKTKKDKENGVVFGVKGYTYIQECKYERNLGRSVTTEINAKPLTWGKVLEKRVFQLLPFNYTICSAETTVHETIKCWAGSSDGVSLYINLESESITECKCPYTLKSFCDLVQPIYDGHDGIEAINIIRKTHKDGEKYYWQMVSNAIINKTKTAELIVYMPYKAEIDEIKKEVDGDPNCYYITNALEEELPYLPDNGYYKNMNKIMFDVPQEDIDFLTTRVLEAEKILLQNNNREIC